MTLVGGEVTLDDGQRKYVQQLLFEELQRAAQSLADMAHAAVETRVGCENIAGDDAQSTWHARVRLVVELLDAVGWSMLIEKGGE